jgi:hypothetical protein
LVDQQSPLHTDFRQPSIAFRHMPEVKDALRLVSLFKGTRDVPSVVATVRYESQILRILFKIILDTRVSPLRIATYHVGPSSLVGAKAGCTWWCSILIFDELLKILRVKYTSFPT